MRTFINAIFSKLERAMYSNWYNPFSSLYVNLRLLPFNQAIKLPIAVYGRPKLIDLRGNAKFNTPIKFGIITINRTHPEAPSYQGNQAELLIRGRITFYGSGQIDTGTKIYIGAYGELQLGKYFKISDMVNIGCTKYIRIGNTSRISHRSQVLDSNYHFIANLNSQIIPPTVNPIIIGDNVWVGNSTTISGGAIIPDTTIVASNSLVNKDFSQIPKFSLIGGIPAKKIATGFRRIEDPFLTMKLYKYYLSNNTYYSIPESLDESVFHID